MIKALYLILLMVLGISLNSCTFDTPGSMGDKPSLSTKVIIEKPQNEIPPIVRISGNDYSMADLAQLTRIAEGSSLSVNTVGWTISNQQNFIDSAINQAGKLDLDSQNLENILTRLILHVDQLDFSGKNLNESGVAWTFLISNKTIQLPFLIEKARYQGREAWMILLNWEMNDEDRRDIPLSHIALVAFEYGSEVVFVAMSCA